MSGGLMVCGTTSDSGKTTLVTGLCRVLARRGVDAPQFRMVAFGGAGPLLGALLA